VDRGIVKIKPVFIGISHYRDVYGSVCSADVKGTPVIKPPSKKEIETRTLKMVDSFKKQSGKLDFVEIEKPFIIKEHSDFRKLSGEINFGIDALLVGTMGNLPLELRTLSRYNLPITGSQISEEYLRALKVKKYLKESKFLYIGEIPSFSAPEGPYDFQALEGQLGIRVRHIETNEFYRWFDRFSEKQVTEQLNSWKKDFAKVIEPDEKELMNATRVYMALRGLCEREDANGLTVNCGRFTEERPVVPCLAFARLIDEGIMCACEGDITAMLSSFIIHAVSGQSMLMGNFGSRQGKFEAEKGEVTIEHDIIPLSMASNRFTVRDYHGRKFGVTGYANIKKNPMTVLNIDKSLKKMSVLEGQIKRSKDGIHCRVIVHMNIDGDVKKVPEIIVGSQHVSMTFGHWLAALKETGNLLGMEVKHL
jgi:L-fucose isomerase-like protein